MTALLGVAGLAAIAIGLGMIWIPLGIIAAGVEGVVLSWLNDDPAK